MDLDDIWEGAKGVLSGTAPVLANAIIPGSGGLAATLISKALGCENKPKAVAQALTKATPEQLNELKRLELKHQEKLTELALENDKLYIQDVQSARNREIAIVQATGKRDINLYVLAWSVVVGFFALVGLMMFVKLPDYNIGPINQLFGALAAGFGMVLSYFFGSSKSSSDKNAFLTKK